MALFFDIEERIPDGISCIVLNGLQTLSTEEKINIAFHFFDISRRDSPNPESGVKCSMILKQNTDAEVEFKFSERADASLPSELERIKSELAAEMQRTFIWRYLHSTFDMALHRHNISVECAKLHSDAKSEMKAFVTSDIFTDTLALFYTCMGASTEYSDDIPFNFPSYDFKRMVQCKAIKEDDKKIYTEKLNFLKTLSPESIRAEGITDTFAKWVLGTPVVK